MKIRYLLAASVAALITAGGAKAADIINYQEPAAPVFSWQGFYIGGEIGGMFAKPKLSATNIFGEDASWSPKPKGILGGIYAGYNMEFGQSFVVGFDIDYTMADASKSKNIEFADGVATGRVKQKWLSSARLRAGYAMDRLLPYIAAGFAYGKVDSRISLKDVENVTVQAVYKGGKNFSGWTAGAGVDYAMSDNIMLRLEYRYTDLGDNKFNFPGDINTKVKYKTNDIRVGVAYKF